MKRVLFLCTGNSARSQMAEGWAKHLDAGRAEFHSAGTRPSQEVNRYAVLAMLEKGVDLTAASPKAFDKLRGPFDVVVTVCSRAAEECPLPSYAATVHSWDLPDPAAASGSEADVMKAFRESREEIERRVRALLLTL